MVTLKNGIGSVIAGAAGVIALCIPTDIGADLSETGARTSVHAEISWGVRPNPSPATERAKPLVARLEFAQRGPLDPTALPVGRDMNDVAVRSATPDRRLNQIGNVPKTLPASTARPALLPTMPEAPKMSIATIRALQRELTRHGCYSGAIDGTWGPASRYAAATFTEAVNAELPVDQPSEFLLALSRQHQSPLCLQPSGIVTASTTQGWRATVTTNGLPDRSFERPTTTNVLPSAPRLTSPPRIVRANGAHSTIDLTEVSEMPLPPPGEMDQRTQMALGAEPSTAQRSEPEPITRDSAIRRERETTRRAAALSRQRQARKRAPRWRRQVLQSVNLSGS